MSSRWPSRTRPTITLLAPSSQRVAEEQWSCEEKVQNADGSIEYVDWWDFTGMELFHEFITYFVRGYLRAIRRPDTTPRSCGSQFYRENPNAIDVDDVNVDDADILNPVPVDSSSDDDTPLANTPGRAARRARAHEVRRPSSNVHQAPARPSIRAHRIIRFDHCLVVLRRKAMERQAEKMRKRAARLDGGDELPPGSIVRLAIHDVDRAKLDNSTAVCVVLQKEKKSYRVANRGGVYKELISRAHLQLVPNATPQIVGLADMMRDWKTAPHVSIRAIARAQSHAGGQGFLRCNCKGDCMSPRCKCFREGYVCNSRCHPKNSRCCNHDGT